jgi:hypothetical protein
MNETHRLKKATVVEIDASLAVSRSFSTRVTDVYRQLSKIIHSRSRHPTFVSMTTFRAAAATAMSLKSCSLDPNRFVRKAPRDPPDTEEETLKPEPEEDTDTTDPPRDHGANEDEGFHQNQLQDHRPSNSRR